MKNYDGLLDAGFNAMKNGCTKVSACSDQPADYAGIAALELITETISSSDFTGPADGTVSGRKLTFNGVSGSDDPTAGTVTHLAFHNGSDTLYAVTTTTSQVVASGQVWDIPSCVIEITDPS